jgi:hypothetical protein
MGCTASMEEQSRLAQARVELALANRKSYCESSRKQRISRFPPNSPHILSLTYHCTD